LRRRSDRTSLRLLIVLALLNAGLAVFGIVFYRYVVDLESRVYYMERSMELRPVTRITTSDGRQRTTYRAPDETSEDYAQRVLALATSGEPAGHLCTTLTGCLPDGETTLEHCTPYVGESASNTVKAQHEADVAALCATLECADCGD
jgi:hypothetical protein